MTCQSLGYAEQHCCTSCHEDVAYGYDLLEVELPDGRTALVCCRVALALENDLGDLPVPE